MGQDSSIEQMHAVAALKFRAEPTKMLSAAHPRTVRRT